MEPSEAPRQCDSEEVLEITDALLAGGEKADERTDFESEMSPVPIATSVLIAANVVIFAMEWALGFLRDEASITAAGALVRERVLNGEVWRIPNSMFLHGGLDHIIGNCLVLYVVGMACEHAVGVSRMLLLYFVSGVSGALASMAMHPGPSVGASGAIFGVAGAVIVFLYKHQDRYCVRDKRIGFVLAFWAVYQIACGFLMPFVDNYAHIGGLMAGAGTMMFMNTARSRPAA